VQHFACKKSYPKPLFLTYSVLLSSLQLQAICFVCFLVGFITVLCIGNYFRAKRAQERQRQRRLAKLAASNNAAAAQGMYATDGNFGSSSYEAPAHVPSNSGVQA
jgi:hypothetical protein